MKLSILTGVAWVSEDEHLVHEEIDGEKAVDAVTAYILLKRSI